MNELRSWIIERLNSNDTVVLVAVTHASGSTARGTDALMAMDMNGRMEGTVGGGYVENQAIIAIRKLLEIGGDHQDLFFDLSPEAQQNQMTCGGKVSLHLERVDPQSEACNALKACFERLESGSACSFLVARAPEEKHCFAIDEKGNVLYPHLQTEIQELIAKNIVEDIKKLQPDLNGSSGLSSSSSLCSASCRSDTTGLKSAQAFCGASCFELELPEASKINMARVFQLGFRPDPVAYIFGAGHVGKATSVAASLVGFQVVITDDRPELLTRERFPKASMLRIIDSFADPLAASRDAPAIEIGPQDCAMILTRKPDIDKEMLSCLLRTKAGYIGLIGSKTKRDGIFAALREEGFSDIDLSRVHSPIGLGIGAETPEEIAISIMAEVIAVRSGVLTQLKC